MSQSNLPAEVDARVYPSTSKAPVFPEMQPPRTRYLPQDHPIGVAISGGGSRSFSCAIGQLRGLCQANLLDKVGAISSVSGGSWFSSLLNYAPAEYTDNQLLGRVVDPSDITIFGGDEDDRALDYLPPHYLGYPIHHFDVFGRIVENFEKGVPWDRLWSRMLNDDLLGRFGRSDLSKQFSLDGSSVDAIAGQNPDHRNYFEQHFFTLREDRPFWIANSTLQYPVGDVDRLVHFEFSPLYSGSLGEAGKNTDLDRVGGGYVDTFAFNSDTPSGAADQNELVTVPTRAYPFLLSDAIGSSSAAPGGYLEHIQIWIQENLGKNVDLADLMPQFEYWPVRGAGVAPVASQLYSIVDGGVLEDTGIVPLLRRGYPLIIAFVNAEAGLNTKKKDRVGFTYEGVTGQITRLFGHQPPDIETNSYDTTIFNPNQFDQLKTDFNNQFAAGNVPYSFREFEILEGNYFGLEPRTVKILWYYNSLDWSNPNCTWYHSLELAIRLMFDDGPISNLGDFPNYATAFQNDIDLLRLTKAQINLLAHMWGWSVAGQHDHNITSILNGCV